MKSYQIRSLQRRWFNGFTLVECLVVIAIITVLISMTIPVISKVREHATRIQCIANLRAIQVGMVAYATANSGWYPLPTGDPANADGGDTINTIDGEERQARTSSLQPQMGGIGWMIGRQASMSPTKYSGNGRQPYVTSWQVFYCPSIQKRYMTDPELGRWWTTDDKAISATNPLPTTKAGTLRNSNYIQWNPWSTQANYAEHVAKRLTDSPRLVLTGDRLAWQANGSPNYWKFGERNRNLSLYSNHSDGANFAFNDGHVEYYRVKSLQDKTGFLVTGRSNVGNTQQWYCLPDVKKNY